MRPAFLEKDAEKQKELYQKFLTDNIAPHVAIVEKHLEKNGTGYLVGSEVGVIQLFLVIFNDNNLKSYFHS